MAPKKEKDSDPGWAHCIRIDDDRHKVRCRYCDKTMSGGVNRLKQHLANISGEVKGCNNVPTEVRKEMRSLMLEKKAEKQKKKEFQDRVAKMDFFEGEEEEDDEGLNEEERELQRGMRASREEYERQQARMNEVRGGAGSSGAGGSFARPPTGLGASQIPVPADKAKPGSIDPFLYRSQSVKQPKISFGKGDMKAKALKIGRAISKFFHYNHIPPNVATSPYYRAMIETIAEAGPGVKPPSSYEISNKYLKMEVDDYKNYLAQMRSTWEEYGCTIMCDGWTSSNRYHLVNFMVYCRMGSVFLKSIDTTGQSRTAQYLFGLINNVIGEIGASNIVQLVTDNEASFKAAGNMVTQHYGSIVWTPCCAHCIDLMMEDIASLPDVKDVFNDAKSITSFIYNYEKMIHYLRQHTGGREILRPNITRFATEYVSLESLIRIKRELIALFSDSDWLMDGFPRRMMHVAEQVMGTVMDTTFWKKAERICYLLEPLVKILKFVDGERKPTLPYVYDGIDKAKLAMQSRSLEKNYGNYYKRLWKIIDNRWNNQLHQEIHAAAYYLNQKCFYSEHFSKHEEVFRGFRNSVITLESDVEEQITILNQISSYESALGIFGSHAAIVGRTRMEPADWWRMFGTDVPELRRFAMRICSQTSSSTGCERNWSTFGRIHTKSRNRLKMDKLNDLVFVHYNMRLRARNLESQTYPRSEDDHYDPINWDYIFEEDDPLNEWLSERDLRNPMRPKRQFVEALDDEDDEDEEAIPSTQVEPLVRRPRKSCSSAPTGHTITAKDKGKGVMTPSSQVRSQKKGDQKATASSALEKAKNVYQRLKKGAKASSHFSTLPTHEEEEEEEEQEKHTSSSSTASPSNEAAQDEQEGQADDDDDDGYNVWSRNEGREASDEYIEPPQPSAPRPKPCDEGSPASGSDMQWSPPLQSDMQWSPNAPAGFFDFDYNAYLSAVRGNNDASEDTDIQPGRWSSFR